MIIRLASADDLPTLLQLRRERAEWLRSIGSDQWQVGLTEEDFVQRVEQSIEAGETWIAVTDSGAVIGTIAVDEWTRPGLWSAEELANSLIIHRMITPQSSAGTGVGRKLLAHVERLAVAVGRPYLRLDAWTTNEGLHRYYERNGFRHVRTVKGHPSKSTALFERQATLTLPSTLEQYVTGEPDHAGNPTAPDHMHHVIDLVVSRPPMLGTAAQLEVGPGCSWRLWWEEGAWRAAPPNFAGRESSSRRELDKSSCRVTEWRAQPPLSTEHEYLIEHRTQNGQCGVQLTPCRLPTEAQHAGGVHATRQ